MPTTASVTIETDRLDGAREAWDSLVREQQLVSPFQCSWWLEAPGAAAPVFVLVRGAGGSQDDEGGELLGGLALQETRRLGVRRLTFRHQGVLCPDHLDLVARPGSEEPVAQAVARWAHGPGARVLDLDGLRPGSLLGRALGGARGQVDAVAAPFQPLPGDDYLATRSAAFRRSVRRGTTSLARAGVVHEQVAPDGLEAAWTAFRRLHADRPGRGALLERLDTLEHAVAAAHDLGEARLDVMAGPDGPVAVSVAFLVAGRLSLYQLARSLAPEHASAGTVLLHAVIADAAAAGAHEVDLLRGDEDYKARFADHRRQLGTLRVGSGAGRVVAGATGAALTGRRTLGRARRAVRPRPGASAEG